VTLTGTEPVGFKDEIPVAGGGAALPGTELVGFFAAGTNDAGKGKGVTAPVGFFSDTGTTGAGIEGELAGGTLLMGGCGVSVATVVVAFGIIVPVGGFKATGRPTSTLGMTAVLLAAEER